MRFYMNGYLWEVVIVPPNSSYLVDRSRKYRLATTDPNDHSIYISNAVLRNEELYQTVILHELGHAAMFSYNLLDDIHRVTPRSKWIETEEWICEFIAIYGRKILNVADNILGGNHNG